MLTMRCYPPIMAKETQEPEMSEFGRAMWAMIQERGAFSRAGIARKIKNETGWEISRQAVSNYLNGERGVPRELVPAVNKAFGLSAEEAKRLEYLYFYGQGGAAGERWRRAQDEAEREDDGPSDKDP